MKALRIFCVCCLASNVCFSLRAAGELLLSARRVAEVRTRLERSSGAHAWWTNLTTRLDAAAQERRLRPDRGVPERGGQWWNYYFCKNCNQLLVTQSDTRHVCPKCARTYAGWPYDDAALLLRHMALADDVRAAGLAFLLSGEGRWVEVGRRILLDYAERRPHYVLHDNWGKAHPTLGGYVTSQALDDAVWLVRIVQGYDAIRPMLSTEEADRIARTVLVPEAEFLLSVDAGSLRTGNHECWHAVAVGLVGRVLGMERFAKEAERRLDHQLKNGINGEGVWCEGAWGYHFYAMKALLPYFQALANCGEVVPESYHRMFLAPFGQMMSGWRLPANGDTDAMSVPPGSNADLYLAAAKMWPNDRMIVSWAAAAADSNEAAVLWGIPNATESFRPTWRSCVSRSSGMAVLRSGLMPDGSPRASLAFDFGPHGGWHGHLDKLSYEVWFDGACVADDPGCGNYADPLHFAWMREALAHNTVSVDGKGQRPCEGKLLSFIDSRDMPTVIASAPIAEGVTAVRAVALAGDVILDLVRIMSRTRHVYDWAFHAKGDCAPALSLSPASLGALITRTQLKPEAWDGSEAYTWLENPQKSAHDGAWLAVWTNANRSLTVRQSSSAGELYKGLGWQTGGRERTTVVFNRVEGTNVVFATVIDLGSHDVGILRTESSGGQTRLITHIDGHLKSLTLGD